MEGAVSESSTSERKVERSPGLAQPSPKLHIPVIPREFLERPRLRRRFDAALSRKVILVSAPAGYGKTVFLGEALANINRPVAWLSLDKRDNYFARFWASLIIALQKVQPGLGEHTLAMLRFRKPSVESALTELVNEISEAVPDLNIVLDDYHEINTQAIHDSLAFLLEYLPPQVRLFISSRVAPPLPLARLRGRGHLAEIKASDLQFTREETYSFLNEVMGLALYKEQVDSIYDRTEGWIAGLQMVAVSMQGCRDATEFMPAFKGTNKDIMEYLTKEVLQQQKEHIRTFLLETCILERLNESLCKAVTGRDDSQRILEQLVANHLFLQPLDDEGRWFRYHHLFRDLLHKQLEATQPGILPALHSRASEWYESQGLMEDAIEHALTAEKFDRAADLIQHIAFAVLGQDKHSMIQDWVTKLPEELIDKNLRICIAGALACEAFRQPEIGEPYRRYIRLISEAMETPAQLSSLDADTTRGLLAIVNAIDDSANGNVSRAIKSQLEELKSLPEDEAIARCLLNVSLGVSYWAKGELAASYRYCEECVRLSKLVNYTYHTTLVTALLAHVRFAWGHLHSAAEVCREAIQLGTAGDGKESPVACYARLLLGEILYQWNSLDESRDNILRAIDLSEQGSEPVIHLNGHMALARIKIALGESDAAIDIARRAKITHEGSVGHRLPGDIFLPADIFMTRLWLIVGNVAAASDYAHTWSKLLPMQSREVAQRDSSPDLIQYGIYGNDMRDVWSEIPVLTFVRLRLAQGKREGMLELLEDVCQDVEGKGWTNIMVEALILKSLVLHAEGKLRRALRTLENVLAMTENEGYVRVFIDEGLPMFQLLQRAASRGIAPSYVSKLLGAFHMPVLDNLNQYGQSRIKGTAPSQLKIGWGHIAEPLTKREIEVLELIAAGFPNRAIAQKLAISLYTVKNHLKHIYQKLDVDNRARASMRARDIGLLKATLPGVQ